MSVVSQNNDLLQKIAPYNYAIGTSHLVKITHINHPHSFYAVPIHLREDMKRLENQPEQLTPPKITPGLRVMYKSAKLKRFIRGDVVSANLPECCAVYAVDYGFYDKEVKPADIVLPQETLQKRCPPLALHCKLHLCEPKNKDGIFDKETVKVMKEFVGRDTARIDIMNQEFNKFIVELVTSESPDDVGSMLTMLDYTTFLGEYTQLIGNRSLKSTNHSTVLEYKSKDLTVGERLHVTVVHGSSVTDFYAVNVDDYMDYKAQQNEVSEYASRIRGLNIETATCALNQARCCVARVEPGGEFQRCFITKVVSQNKCIVKLIDWGKEQEVEMNSIVEVKTLSCVKKPAMAIYCTAPLDQFKTGAPDPLYHGFQCIIEVIKLGQGYTTPNKVNIFQIPYEKYVKWNQNCPE